MNYLDIILILPLLFGAWRGFKKGLIIELFTLLALLVALYAGIHFSDWMAGILQSTFNSKSEYLPIVSFTLIFLAVGAMVYFAGKAIEAAVNAIALSPLNKVAGMIFGMIKYLFLLSTTLVILESYDQQNQFLPAKVRDESLLYHPVKNTALYAIPGLKNSAIFIQAVQ